MTELERDIKLRPHSWRGYEPQEFMQLARETDQRTARGELKTVEAGRLAEMLRYTHKFFTPLDADEKRDWANRNPDMVEWMGVWAALEDQDPHTEFTGVERDF